MKKIFVLMSAALVMMSCGAMMGTQTAPQPTTQNTTANQINQATATAQATQSTVATPADAGKAAGTSILALYNQYQADGKKYDYKNLSNISNTLILMANCAELPSKAKDKEYMQQFSQGMMLSAASLITPENVGAVTDNLTNMAGQYAQKAANATSSAAEKLNTAAQTAGAVANMLTLFQK